MLEQTIASLAILKVNSDQGKDYIQNFVPFVAECVRMSKDEVISTDVLKRDILREFGLRIPSGPLNTILARAVHEGYLRKEHKVYYKNEDKFDLSFVVERERLLRSHERLVDQLISFISTKYQTEWTRDQADAALLEYLAMNSVSVLSAAITAKPMGLATSSRQDVQFLVNAFVDDLYRSEPTDFEFLETLVKGRMLADVLVLFDDLNIVTRPFQGVEVYFDTPFLLRAMGCSGDSIQSPCLELMHLLTEHNAKLCVFSHTFDETEGVLERCLRALRDRASISNQRGEALQYFVDERLSPSDIELIIRRMPGQLNDLNIHIKEAPSHTVPLGVDEQKLRETLQQEVRYREKDGSALDRDVASLTAIHRLRVGSNYHFLETCRAIFVTSNTPLAYASSKFYREEYGSSKAPHCVLDHVLATMVWLKKPLKASSDLPRKQIIASCYAAMKPPENLWAKYLNEVDKLQRAGKASDNDVQLMRASVRPLMDITHGNEDAFTDGTADQVLEIARAAIAEEERQKIQSDHDRATAELAELHQGQIADKEERFRTLALKLQLKEDEEEKAQRRIEEFEAARSKRQAKITFIAVATARVIKMIVLILISVTLIGSAYMSLPLPATFPRLLEGRYKHEAWAMLIIGAVLGLYFSMSGGSGQALVCAAERATVAWLNKSLTRIAGL